MLSLLWLWKFAELVSQGAPLRKHPGKVIGAHVQLALFRILPWRSLSRLPGRDFRLRIRYRTSRPFLAASGQSVEFCRISSPKAELGPPDVLCEWVCFTTRKSLIMKGKHTTIGFVSFFLSWRSLSRLMPHTFLKTAHTVGRTPGPRGSPWTRFALTNQAYRRHDQPTRARISGSAPHGKKYAALACPGCRAEISACGSVPGHLGLFSPLLAKV
jgi:hypothetical protein